jgi:hypothetical protein
MENDWRAWQEQRKLVTRRHFFRECRLGVGAMALASLLERAGLAAGEPAGHERQHRAGAAGGPLAPRAPHHPARARNVIYLFMAGGPSQLDLFDHKPVLARYDGQVVPPDLVKDKRYAFIRHDAKLMATPFRFARAGKSGAELSELLPGLAAIADDIAIVKSMVTDAFNHAPAQIFLNTGAQLPGRPSMGSWVTYGLGSEAEDLPAFVVLSSGGGTSGGAANWGSGFLPSVHAGVPFRRQGDPILNVASPPGIDARRQRDSLDLLASLNRRRPGAAGDPEIESRIAAYEMAYRMQASAPELMDIKGESPRTLEAYGAEPGKASFANNCLLARRLVERGVRFVQLYHTDWDHHGNLDTNLDKPLETICREVDRPAAALVRDLKERGLFDDTLVVWGGEFGRTPMGEPRDLLGRDHHIDGYTVWLAGGGIRGGQTIGATDELGFYAVDDPVHVHDLQATILHLLGLDHKRLTFRFQGREHRLTDVAGEVVAKMLA